MVIKDDLSGYNQRVYLSGSSKVSGDRIVAKTGDFKEVTVTTSPVVLIGERADMKGWVITPLGSIFVGIDDTVSSLTGFPVSSGDIFRNSGIDYVGNLYWVTSSGSVPVRTLRIW